MGGHMILYRGSLKSCNYHCSYCPFSKRERRGGDILNRELRKDREQWFSFVRMLLTNAKKRNIRALLVTPYGEAMIHAWYWEGLAQLTALQEIDAAGAQTNLSFPIERYYEVFEKAGGRSEKLRLWATFHPEMSSVTEFAKRCRKLWASGIRLCAGAVGVPRQLALLKRLREELPEEIYFWINRMDGLRRPYTPEEIEAFSEIDPYFYRELLPHPANDGECAGRIFAEGDGRIRTCNISPVHDAGGKELWEGEGTLLPECSRRRCSCYLAYGGRENVINQALFGPYPLFRIPRHPKAVFLDIAGTLIPGTGTEFDRAFPAETVEGLFALKKENAFLFFATTLPYREAVRRCRGVCQLFDGGVFAAGAHLLLKKDGKRKEYFYFLNEDCLSFFKPLEQRFGFRILTLKSGGRCYKITLLRTRRRPWSGNEAQAVFDALPKACRNNMRYLTEGNCLQIVSARADKARGVEKLCEWLSISPGEAFAAGDSKEDAEMIRLCGTVG